MSLGAIVIFVVVLLISIQTTKAKNRDNTNIPVSGRPSGRKSKGPDVIRKNDRMPEASADQEKAGDPSVQKGSGFNGKDRGFGGPRSGGRNTKPTPAEKNKRSWRRASRISDEKEQFLLRMEDRENDWLARQIREEKRLAEKMCYK